jgi:hypothetical protein
MVHLFLMKETPERPRCIKRDEKRPNAGMVPETVSAPQLCGTHRNPPRNVTEISATLATFLLTFSFITSLWSDSYQGTGTAHPSGMGERSE